jgi:hypothetical protein
LRTWDWTLPDPPDVPGTPDEAATD